MTQKTSAPPANRPKSAARAPATSPAEASDLALREACDPYDGLYAMAARGKRIINDARLGTVNQRIELGRLLQQATKKRYERGATKILADAWDLTVGQVLEIRELADRYDQDAVVRFRVMRGVNGLPLPFSHFLYAGRIQDVPRRFKLLERAAAEGWGASRVNDEVVKINGELDGLPQSQASRSLRATVRKLGQRAHAAVEASDLDDLDDLITEVPPDKVNADTLAEIAATEGVLDALAGKIAAARSKLAEAHSRLDGILKAQASLSPPGTPKSASRPNSKAATKAKASPSSKAPAAVGAKGDGKSGDKAQVLQMPKVPAPRPPGPPRFKRK